MRKAKLKVLVSVILFILIYATAALAGNVMVVPGTDFQPQRDYKSFKLQKMLIPNKGFASGTFGWNAERNSWDLKSSLPIENPSLIGGIELWKCYWENPSPVSEKISIWAGGFGVTGVSFVSPKGVTYTNCVSDGTFEGMAMFNCEKEHLPVGQTEFASGRYIFKFKMAGSSTPVTRYYYLSGSYPTQFKITYPTMNAVNVSKTFTAKWQAVGAGYYDFCLYDYTTGKEVYNTLLINTIATSLSQTIPAAKLQPNTKYELTIEAKAPEVNGGSKGIKKSVVFTTGN